ncbi:uncharacterized protein LOC103569450 [Microplitis demolitor]|uniref:uncharacterized protein LOC103569450 n=1 Tax=Microplitis demolitor TaxID=69319 RepID=UPI0004CCD03A|nr:uncharacterized protein LOC103569450 [Microplitis demolitor]XP_008544977.1 uncharacterized protein LOC103569450 [Microplitis demolitor]
MKFLILPLLVVTQLNHSDSWINTLVVYNVTYNAEMIPRVNETQESDHKMSFNLTTQLKCRPVDMTLKALHCYLEDSKMLLGFHDSTNSTSPPKVMTGDALIEPATGVHFELKMNALGIKEMVVPASISPLILDKLRYIANQLHSGIDMVGKTEGVYHNWENFTTGECFTTYNVKLNDTRAKQFITKEKNGKYKMWSPNMRVTINKTRDLKNCKSISPYFFGSRESWRENPKMSVNITSSQSSVIVDRGTFISSTQTALELHELKDSNSTSEYKKMRENITVIFDSMIKDEQNVTSIENPASAGIITGQWLYGDESSEESNESPERNSKEDKD